MPSLRVIRGDAPILSVSLDRDVIVLGRAIDCDLVLDDHKVSSRHARIVRQGGYFILEDLGSKNGTCVANRELVQPYRLVDGDLIEVGNARILFTERSTSIKSAADVFGSCAEDALREKSEAKLRALLDISTAIGGTIDLDGVLAKILEALFSVLPQAQRGLVLLQDENSDEPILKASLSRKHDSGPQIYSRTIFHHVTTERRAVLCEDMGTDPRFGSSPSVLESNIRTMICVPLFDRLRLPMGVIQVDTTDAEGRFDDDDLGLIAAVGGPVAVVIENARLHEVAVRQAEMQREVCDARAVQLAMIPSRRPNVAGYEFWHFYEPAHSVGGDYFDYRPLAVTGPSGCQSPDRWAVAIGDVAGKGMPAALMMARLSSEVALHLQIDPDPARVVERLNRNLCAAGLAEKPITFLMVLLDPSQHEMTVVNAGHFRPLLRRADGLVEEIHSRQGMVLGVDVDSVYDAERIAIRSGEVIVLYSDGITDAGEGERDRFEIDRLKQSLAGAGPGASRAGEAILGAVRRHATGLAQFDDMTLLCFSRD